MIRIAGLAALLLAGCERPPSLVGPWDLVRVERGGDTRVDVGFLDFDGEGSVVVFLAYDHDESGFVPLIRPVYTVETTNVVAVDVETFYEERTPIERVEIGGMGSLAIDEYTGIRAVLSGRSEWLGGGTEVPTTLILRR